MMKTITVRVTHKKILINPRKCWQNLQYKVKCYQNREYGKIKKNFTIKLNIFFIFTIFLYYFYNDKELRQIFISLPFYYQKNHEPTKTDYKNTIEKIVYKILYLLKNIDVIFTDITRIPFIQTTFRNGKFFNAVSQDHQQIIREVFLNFKMNYTSIKSNCFQF